MTGDFSYQAVSLPDWASLNTKTGVISGTPDETDVSTYVPFEIKAANENKVVTIKGHLVVAHNAAFRDQPAYDFYAQDYGGKSALRNDLGVGELQGEVQFVQSHAMAPSHEDNYHVNKADQTLSQYKPDITPLRETLLLFMPEKGMDPVTVNVKVLMHGALQMTLSMVPPNELPGSDNPTRLNVQYSTRAWSVVLPWDVVKPGLSLQFTTNKGAPSEKIGRLVASKIDMSDASRIVIRSIRLGMLTHPPSESKYTLNHPIKAAADYFQTVPTSKLIMSSYADMQLNRVMIWDGTIYNDKSDYVGAGAYSGDMRGNVAKSQVSVGTNLANAGITSWDMTQGYPLVFKQTTSHFACGRYTDEKGSAVRQCHGLSGGNGIATLYASAGNEASHEWGHGYGLGHYPGGWLTDDGRWQRHHFNSGWGYIMYRDRMRSSVTGVNDSGQLTFGTDAMSGGWVYSPFSRYTYHTGYTARLIQNQVSSFPIPDADFATGYKKWDSRRGDYVTAHPTINGGESAPVPVATGVPVATIIGAYEPNYSNSYQYQGNNSDAAVIYPVFHGNYGNVFDYSSALNLDDGKDHCWVRVSNAAGQVKKVEVLAHRHSSGTVNQLHFNLRADFRPTSAKLYCYRASTGEKTLLTKTTFSGNIPELPPVAIVGQEKGVEQLKHLEIQTIQKRVMALPADKLHSADMDLITKINSYSRKSLKADLTRAAWRRVNKILAHQEAAQAVVAELHYSRSLELTRQERTDRLKSLLMARGLLEQDSGLSLNGMPLTNSGWYVGADLNEAGYLPILNAPDSNSHKTKWLMDTQGKLHPVNKPAQCLTPVGTQLTLSLCDPQNKSQKWVYKANKTLQNLQSYECLDYDSRGKKRVITWSCHGRWNQQWNVARSQALWLSLLEGSVIKEVTQLLGS